MPRASRRLPPAALAALVLLGGCAPARDAPPPQALARFAGAHVAVMLGFTRCPDVCPTGLWQWHRAMRALTDGERAGLRLAFVSVDPERDTSPVLDRHVAHFDPAFVGVRVEGDELRGLLRFLRAHARKVPSRTPGEYTVDHTAVTVLLDPEGRRVAEFRHGTESGEIARRLRAILARTPSQRASSPSARASRGRAKSRNARTFDVTGPRGPCTRLTGRGAGSASASTIRSAPCRTASATW